MTLRAAVLFFSKVDSHRLFAEPDAWGLFKYAAWSEVVGWSLLIYGIAADKLHLPGQSFMLPLGGSIHGMLYLYYVGVLAATYSSLGWTRFRALVGFVVSNLPYGTLVFELWVARRRRQRLFQAYRRITVRAVIRRHGTWLCLQPGNSVVWQLPGGPVEAGETTTAALARITRDLLGTAAEAGKLVSVDEARPGQLELYFEVGNAADFAGLDLAATLKRHGDIDELKFVDPRQVSDIAPAVLRLL